MPSICTTMNPSSANCLRRVKRPKRLGHEGALRAGVDLLDHRIFLVGVEVRRPEDHAVNVRRRCRAPWRRSAPASSSRFPARTPGRARSSSQTRLPSLTRRSSVTGSHIHARIRVEEEAAIRRILDTVRAVALGENDQAAAIEIDPAIMDVIGILVGVDAAGAEPDLPRLVIDAIDAAHHPTPLGDLVFHSAGVGVVEIEMVPAVALRHPDDFIRFIEIVGEELAAVVDEGFALFVDDGAGVAGLRHRRRRRAAPDGRAGCTGT